MNPDVPRCPQCGAALTPDAALGLCARCLLAGASEPTDVGTVAPRVSPPPTLEEVAAAFPQLEILALIGAGGMGAVFRARQPKLNRLVALKVLPASLAEHDPAFAERFEREGQMLARLHHPNIVAVHDSGRAGEFFYLLMEHVDGVNLRQAMRASRFTPAQALGIVPRICDALQFAHEEGVLHRDIKPENILLDAKGRVKLADFGIGKIIGESGAGVPPVDETPMGETPKPRPGLTQIGIALGTPQYMAPEQRDQPELVDHRADIYSLGVVFYELLTGELPVGKFAPPSQLSASDPRVDAIVRQALEKERDRRQQSAGEVRTQVETIAGDATPSKDDPETWLKSRRSAWFQSPLQEEIHAHMSVTEKREMMMRQLMFSIWNAATWFLPVFIIFFTHSSARWIYATLVLVVGLGGLSLWSKILQEGLCSTAWARQRGFTSAQLRKSGDALKTPRWVRTGWGLALFGMLFTLNFFVVPAAHWPQPIARGVTFGMSLGLTLLFGYALRKGRRAISTGTSKPLIPIRTPK